MSSINSSTTSLLANSQRSSMSNQKDFSSALASLQCSYGAYGSAPVLPSGQKTQARDNYKASINSRVDSYKVKKDNVASASNAFGNLQATYGFVGGLGMSLYSYA